ncbi:Uncharacterised protein [Mycobacteroides abscessus subsp. bolletii]|nr:Uncharacterised protein [Mycobacteroides abscessus subsp. bolletii]
MFVQHGRNSGSARGRVGDVDDHGASRCAQLCGHLLKRATVKIGKHDVSTALDQQPGSG